MQSHSVSSLRSLARRPGFAAVVVLSLALGIAATTTILRVTDTLLLRPVPVAGAERLVDLHLHWAHEGQDDALSYPAFRSYDEGGVLADLAVFSDVQARLSGSGGVEPLDGLLVSPGYFRLLGVQPLHGRGFGSAEAAAPVVVIGWNLWQRSFGGDPATVGSVVQLNDRPYTVIGIAPRGFRGLRLRAPAEFWVPVENLPRIATGFMAQIPVLELPGVRWLDAVGRLPEGVATATAAERLSHLARSVETSASREVDSLRVELTPLAIAAIGREARDKIGGFLRLLGVLVGLELLITCANVSSMFVARALEERRSAAIRFSLGATRASFARPLVLEALVLTSAGAVLGLGMASGLLHWLGTLELPGLAALGSEDFALARVHVAGALTAAALLALVFTGGAAWRLGRLQPADALKDTAPRAGSSRFGLRRGLIALQVALAVVVLTGTGLFARSLEKAWSADPGFRTREVITTSIDLGLHGYDEPRARNLFDELADRLSASPAVAAVSWASGRPLGSGRIEMGIELEGQSQPEDERWEVPVLVVSPGFFETLSVRIEEGRAFTGADRAGAPAVAVVSRGFVERHWPGQRGSGQRVVLPGSDLAPLEVIGVAADVKLDSLDEESLPLLYLPMGQHFGLVGLRPMHLLVRAAGSADDVTPAIRQSLQTIDPTIRLGPVLGLEQTVRQRFVPQQVGVTILGFLALFAVLMVGAGTYALLASYVIQHTREIGLRMALGANRQRVLHVVASRSLPPVLLGLVAGVVLGLLLLELVRSLLYGVQPGDPASFAAALLLVLVIASVAAFVPARRAIRIPPGHALRWE